jgi:hypothetical protein
MAPGLVQEWWVTRRSGYPVVGAVGVAGQAQGSRSFIRRVLHLDPCAWPGSGRTRRRDGIPASAPPVLGAGQPSVVLSEAVNSGPVRHAEEQAIHSERSVRQRSRCGDPRLDELDEGECRANAS